MSGKGSSVKKKKWISQKKPQIDATTKPTDSYDLSERMRKFGEKVNLFIDELRTTGETIFPQDKKEASLSKNHDEIVNSLIESHIDDDMDLVTKSANQQLENQILELKSEIKAVKSENSELKQEIVKLQLELHTIAEHGDIIETLTVEDIPDREDIHEIKEVGVLNYFNPEHWDRLLQLNYKNYLTMPILEILQVEDEIQLIIVALKLEADPADCLEVVKNLQDIGVVDLGFKTQGGLNPLVTRIKHF